MAKVEIPLSEMIACPECGSRRIKLKVRVAYKTYYYQCTKCGRDGGIGKSIAEAVEEWNRAETGGSKPD